MKEYGELYGSCFFREGGRRVGSGVWLRLLSNQ